MSLTLAGPARGPITDAFGLVSLLAGSRRPNVLIECPPAAVEATLRQIMACAGRPLRFCRIPGPLDLPRVDSGTLVLHDVAELTTGQQLALYDWLSIGAGRVQVISLAGSPLCERILDGGFLEGLYYRLNVIRQS